jgi:hypothetical protein
MAFNLKKCVLFLNLWGASNTAFAALDGINTEGVIFVLVVAVVAGFVVLKLLVQSAKIVEKTVLKKTKSANLAQTSGAIAVVIILLFSYGLYVYARHTEKSNIEKNNKISQLQFNVRKAACDYNKEQLQDAILQYIANRKNAESGFSALAYECGMSIGTTEIFRMLLNADAEIYSFRTSKIPGEKYCPWIQMAFDADSRNFIHAIRQENLVLYCSKNTKTSHPWLGSLLRKSKLTSENKIEWIEFLVKEGIDVKARGWYENGYQDIDLIDVAAKLADPTLTKYAISLGLKTDDWVEGTDGKEGRLSALHWWFLKKRSYNCQQSNEVSEMEVLLRPLSPTEINLRISTSVKKWRFYASYLHPDNRSQISPSCYGQKLKEIFALRPIFDDVGLDSDFGILDPWMEWHPSIGEALDLLSDEQVKKLAQPVPFSKPVYKRGSGALGAGEGMPRYLEGRGIKIVES